MYSRRAAALAGEGARAAALRLGASCESSSPSLGPCMVAPAIAAGCAGRCTGGRAPPNRNRAHAGGGARLAHCALPPLAIGASGPRYRSAPLPAPQHPHIPPLDMAAVSLLRPAPFAACRAASGIRYSTMTAVQRLQQQQQQVQRRQVRLAAGRGGGPDRDSDSDRCAGGCTGSVGRSGPGDGQLHCRRLCWSPPGYVRRGSSSSQEPPCQLPAPRAARTSS